MRTIFIAAALVAVTATSSSAGEIHQAAANGDVARVEELLTKNPRSISAVDKYDETPLSLAARFDQYAVAELLLKRGAKVDARSRHQVTRLLNQAVLQFVSSSNSIEDRETAAKWQHNVAMLLKSGIFYDIRAAICLNDVARVRHLLRENENPVEDHDGEKPLRLAAMVGRAEICKLLLEDKADPNEIDGNTGYPVLHAALSHPEIVKLLLAFGANPDVRVTPLVSNFFLGSYVPIVGNNATLLHYAAQEGAVGTAKVLLDNGADVNAVDENWRTPIHVAADCDENEMVKFLLKRGADVNARDKELRTPLSSYEVDVVKKIWEQLNKPN